MPHDHDDFSPPGELKRFPGLEPDDFIHPLDRDALENLKKVPVLDQVVRFINREALERYLYLAYVSSSVRVNRRMLPTLYEKFRWAMDILDLDADLERSGHPEPELYVTQSPFPNAVTAGTDQTFIVLNSGMIDGYDEREWLYVIGHELGHVKAGHVLYQTVARLVLWGLEQFRIPGANLLVIPLLEWVRKAELTADRAAALCVQDERLCQSIHMKLAGGTRSLGGELDLDEFIRQVDRYDERSEHVADLFSKLVLTVFRTHPFPVFRAKELREWMNGFDYERLLKRGREP